jgi:hypothetical protein
MQNKDTLLALFAAALIVAIAAARQTGRMEGARAVVNAQRARFGRDGDLAADETRDEVPV